MRSRCTWIGCQTCCSMTLAESTEILANHIFSKPDPTGRVYVNTNPNAVQSRTGQVNAVPAGGRLVNHTLLDTVNVGPGRVRWISQANILAAIGKASEALIGYTRALVFPI